ncbi:MAG: PHB depolymerase family esterase [Comamonadaceae bacterium]|nr:MAG: PHB depolymerase family esterase [Comamonadaceae bacterium]
MNSHLQHLMAEAMRQTGRGELEAATATLQRALRGDLGTPADDAPAGHSRPVGPAAGAGSVIDVVARRIDEPRAFEGRSGTDRPGADRHARPGEATAGGARREAASSSPASAERWEDGSFAHGGRTLAYKLFVPARADGEATAPRALILMLHGCTQDPADFAAGTRMNELAREPGVAVLYPAQTQHANSQRCWNWFKPQHQRRGRGEPALLAALAQTVAQREGIDAARLYVAGLSAGGAMADILGRAYPDVFAAVGVHSGLPAGAAHDLMSALSAMRGPSGPPAGGTRSGVSPPLIVFHGDADATVHPDNGRHLVAGALGAQDASDAQVTQGKSARGRAFVRSVHEATSQHADIEHWSLRGGGHAWAGGSQAGSYTDAAAVDASAEMLRFFMDHPLAPG